jgi:hypothetical protein
MRIALLTLSFLSITNAARAAEAPVERATAILKRAGYTDLLAPVRIQAAGFMAEARVSVEGGFCYDAALAWDGPQTTMLSIGFEKRPDGKPMNDAFAVVTARLAPPGGEKTFCVDRSGTILVTLTALSPAGTVEMNARFDHTLVLGRRKEGGEAGFRRRDAERARAAAIAAQMDANVAAAKERERRDQALRCRQCDEDYRLCQIEAAARRRNPPPGVTFTTSCEEKFRQCGFGTKAEAYRHPNEWLCGPPPR